MAELERIIMKVLLLLNIFILADATLSCPGPHICQCAQHYDEYIMQCPPIDKFIMLKLNPPKDIEIDCTSTNTDVYENIPNLNVGDIRTVHISQCPIPKGISIYSAINKLHIRNLRSLFFKNTNSKQNTNLERIHLQNLTGVERLYLNNNGITKLPSDLFDDVTNISWIDLQQNKLKQLSKNIFSKLENLVYLELGHNGIESIQNGAFENLKNLKLLNLWGNNLKNLSAMTFKGLDTLTDLDISSSNIESLNENVFDFLPNLKVLNINNNPIIKLPRNLFSQNKNLRRIWLLYNRSNLTVLPDQIFSNLPDLQEVNLKAGIMQIGSHIFQGCYELQNVTITNNYFTEFPINTFENLTNLRRLDISYNKLTNIEDLFTTTTDITLLNLSNNNVNFITRSTLSMVKNLKELDISNNHLTSIDQLAFTNLNALEIVHLEYNQLTLRYDTTNNFTSSYDMGSPFQNCQSLKELYLDHNDISTIFKDWKNLVNLRKLDLSYNNITMITLDDLIFPSLSIDLNLDNNKIQSLNLFDLEKRASFQNDSTFTNGILLTFDNNPFVCDCVLMHLVKYLLRDMNKYVYSFININVSELKCTAPENLKGRDVRSLQMNELFCPLDSPKSSIKKCPAKCKCDVRTYDLTVIVDCSNLNLTSVPQLPNVTANGLKFIELNIENNSITQLPVANNEYSHIRKIYASSNKISTIKRDEIPNNLTVLDIRNNKFNNFNLSIFYKNNKTTDLELLFLSNNQWSCDCSSLDFLYFIQENLNIIEDYKDMTCQNGRLLSESLKDDFCPESNRGIIVLSVILGILGIVFGIMAALFYKYKEYVMVWCHAHNIRIFAEEEIDQNKRYDAFISYSHKDEQFVTEHLVPNLENGPTPYKLCLHIRDWVIGEFIPNQIVTSIEESRRTIVVLSPNFLESAWGKWEFLTAHSSAMKEGRARVIVIILGDIGDESLLDPALRSYLKTNTYIKWGDSWFWDRLRYALPHYKTVEKHKTLFKCNKDDRLELILPSPLNSTNSTPAVERFLNNSISSVIDDSLIESKIKNDGGHVNDAFIINTNSRQSDV